MNSYEALMSVVRAFEATVSPRFFCVRLIVTFFIAQFLRYRRFGTLGMAEGRDIRGLQPLR